MESFDINYVKRFDFWDVSPEQRARVERFNGDPPFLQLYGIFTILFFQAINFFYTDGIPSIVVEQGLATVSNAPHQACSKNLFTEVVL
jgi:hypothetical protein